MSRAPARPLAPRLAAAALALAAALFGWSLCRRGIVLSDEGYLLLQALDLAQGKVLYRDLDAFVAPGVWWLLAGLFRVVEPSVLATRVLAFAGWSAMLLCVARIVAGLASPRCAMAAVAACMGMSVWAFPAWTWSFYSPWSILFALVALERLLAWRRERRRRTLFALGAAVALSGVFKQNYGALAAAGCALGLLAVLAEARAPARARVREARALLAPIALGGALVVVPVVAWLAAQGALGDAFEALVLHPFGGFLGTHDIPYLRPSELLGRRMMEGPGRLTYGAFPLTHTAMRFDWPTALVRGFEVLHVLLYWLPPLLFAGALGLALAPLTRGEPLDGGLAALLAVAGCVFLGVFPRADFNHLMNVYQPVVALAAVVAHRLLGARGALPRLPRRLLLGAAGGLLGAWAALAGYWYVDLLRTLDTPVSGPRGGVLVSEAERAMLDYEVREIRARTRPGEALLALPGFAMLNFLAERPMPGRYYNFYAVHIARDRGAGVVAGAEAAGLQLVVADSHDFFSERTRLREYAPVLTEYLRRYFEPAFSVAIDEHLFLQRRALPLPERETLDALAHCDAGTQGWEGRVVRQHLLFDALYHFLPEGAGERVAETRCRVEVPGPAELRLGLGSRQPSRVEPGSELVAEILVERPGAEPELLHREVLPLSPVLGFGSPPALERRLDLSRWAGEGVDLVLRTRMRGDVRMNELDLKGFAMVWQDPRLERIAAGEPAGAASPPPTHSR